jgi:sugar lactone lactonase YvrE
MRTVAGVAGLCALLFVVACSVIERKPAGGKPSAPTITSGWGSIKLDDKCSSPDGMCIGKDGNIYLSMNNKNTEFKDPCKIMRITPDDKLEDFSELPPHPDTKICSPLGLGFGSDGNLYVSDNQLFVKDAKMGTSRVIRIVIENGKAARTEVVATGLNMANGLACKDDCVYVNDTTLGSEKPMPSGVYCFKISELKADAPVKVTGLNDPHLIFKVLTQNPDPLYQVGANGLDFDSKGNMYVCNFGDAEVIKVTLDKDHKVTSSKSLAKGQGMLSCDGLHAYDEGFVLVADFMGNAIFMINTDSGAVTKIQKNEPCKKPDCDRGCLHAPSECIWRKKKGKIYVSNIDITYGPNVRHDVHTLSVINFAAE